MKREQGGQVTYLSRTILANLKNVWNVTVTVKLSLRSEHYNTIRSAYKPDQCLQTLIDFLNVMSRLQTKNLHNYLIRHDTCEDCGLRTSGGLHILDKMENILLLIVDKKWPQSRVISNIKPK